MLTFLRSVRKCASVCESARKKIGVKHRTAHSRTNQCKILGIETSCDDTGCAIVDDSGNILGEALNSQQEIHLNHGGIVPPVARDLHLKNIEHVVQSALKNANMKLEDVDAIATTVKPGLSLSLLVGMKYGKKLALESQKPFIPIHHMEAHALTIRMVQKVEFPFLVLLISGGHCLLAVARNVDDFLLLGKSRDDAPGEAFDKVARRLKLRNRPNFCNMSGGAAIELAAQQGDPLSLPFPAVMSHHRDCDFSFAGLKNKARRHIIDQEENFGVGEDGIIPGVHDVCASFLLAVAKHLCRRVERAMEYIELKCLLPPSNRVLVVSGGVASNKYIARMLGVVCREMKYKLAIPPPKLCTDNGVMIAWNGVEKWRAGIGIAQNIDEVDIEAKCILGKDISLDVAKEDLKCDWIKEKILLAG
ncbi:hypothetical protein R5R35_014308 [Gryllus longicercus]|uniref:N(6)-L-threonylcarbamoyladenine synthase n=1 Tax=Gryllus longicercus TaxID=2509291 RepID=A0AAN9YXP3_9ORTH